MSRDVIPAMRRTEFQQSSPFSGTKFGAFKQTVFTKIVCLPFGHPHADASFFLQIIYKFNNQFVFFYRFLHLSGGMSRLT
ncbi:hypothetical protein [Paenibacillus mucilaginosus]|uniref:hypothetical protein n=1 Tax=Paenibacillus mucilaginosus TaxID=61624 RepID=UPI003D25FCED